MTETMLISIVMCICHANAPATASKDDKIHCMETYVNCAVIKAGEIRSLQQFDNKCHFQADQERCY